MSPDAGRPHHRTAQARSWRQFRILLHADELHPVMGAGHGGVAEGVGDADRVGRVHQGLVISAGVDPVSKIVSVHRP